MSLFERKRMTVEEKPGLKCFKTGQTKESALLYFRMSVTHRKPQPRK